MNAITWILLAVTLLSLLLTTYASARYFHWRTRARQLHGALEGCTNDLMAAESELVKARKERDFYRDAARGKQPLRERLGLTELKGVPDGARPKLDIVRRS